MKNERHDILYSRARAVLNHNVKRLWFRINPFLERKSTLKGKPEHETKFVQPLQSTILKENYMINDGEESVRDSRNVPIGQFWDFLYSDEWSNGCAVRVLEGELLDTLLYWIYICQKEKYVNCHKTFAFARNTRERRGCYKLANQKGCGEIRETLLLEFTYYGRWVQRPLSSDNRTWSYYPDTMSSTLNAMRSSATESDDEGLREYEHRSQESRTHSFLPPLYEQPLTEPEEDEISQRSCSNYQQSQISQAIEIVPRLSKIDKTLSSASTDSSSKPYPFKENLKKLRCTEKYRCLNEESDSYFLECTEEHKQEDANFGDEFYLNDELEDANIKYTSVTEKLKQRKEVLTQKRKEERLNQLMNQKIRKRRQLPSMPNLDLDQLVISEYTKPTFKFTFQVTNVPSFEDFLNILDVDDKTDPRFKRSRHATKKIPKRYNLTKDTINKRNLEMLDMNTDIQKRFNILKKLPIFAVKGATDNETPKNPKPVPGDLMKVSQQLMTNVQRKKEQEKLQAKTLAVEKCPEKVLYVEKYTPKFAAEVGAVTDSRECENYVLRQNIRRGSASPEKRLYKKSKSKVPNMFVTSPSGNVTTVIGKPPQNSSSPRSPIKFRGSISRKESIKSKQSIVKSKFPSSCSTEAPTTDSEESDYENTLFDSTKLNRKYSLEKVKGKNYRKKKPAFYEILKKYYRAQRAVDLFAKPNADKKIRRKSIFQRLMEQNVAQTTEYKMVIGQMKKLSFLNLRPIKREECEEANFTNLSGAEFLQRLKQSFDDFVVRKELVMSDYKGKTSTTLTFTRKEVFMNHCRV